MNSSINLKFTLFFLIFSLFLLQSCSSFKYRTYDEEANKDIEDPEPNYNITLNKDYQDFISYMYIGNRIENFSTYFNTYFNARENFDDAYEDYVTRVLSVYSERLDSIFEKPPLSQESMDKFNAAIEKASKIIQFHKSSQFMDKSVLLVGEAYYYLGDYLKAERKFSEFISKLPVSSLYEEAVLFLARTQMRLDNIKPALDKLDDIIAKSKDREILSGAYQSKAEYYLSVKDYDNAILNLKKAIEFSSDSEFKAQLQFIVATVTERFDTKKAAVEFEKVMDYGVSYDLEYLARFNNVKNLIANDNFAKALKLLEDMEVKYKDIVQYLGEISFLKGTYFEKRNDMKKAIAQYYYVIQNYPSTKPSSDASYRIAQYEETVKKDYLHAYMYYKFSTEQSSIGTYYIPSNNKAKVYKRYFELRSAIEGMTINTEYDTTFKRKTSLLPPENEENIEHGKEFGKPGGYSLTYESISDSLTEEKRIEDSLKTREKTVSEAKYELAELFLYDLSNPDSSEYYLINAFDNSDDYEFRAKVLFALANLYRSTDREEKSNVVLNRIIQEFPSSQFAFSSKKILNIYVEDDNLPDPADSLYSDAENNFMGKSYPDALNSFKNIIARFPDSKYSDRSLYAVGWIYENILMKPDSAYMYYFSLKQKSPESELSLFVNPKITEYETFMKKDIPDSSLNKDTLVSKDSSKSNIQNPEIKEQENKTYNSEGIQSETEKDNPSIKKEEDKIQNDEKK